MHPTREHAARRAPRPRPSLPAPLLALALACGLPPASAPPRAEAPAPPSNASSAPSSAHALDPTTIPAALDAAQLADAPAPAAAPADAAAPAAAPTAAPSQLAAHPQLAHRRVVAPDAQPGLLELVAELPPEGDLWVGKLAGNGGRDVLVYIPPGARPEAPFRLVYHFHGTSSEHIERQAPGVPKERSVGWDRLTQTLEGARALQAAVTDNVALVYPFSAGKRMEPEWQGWSNKVYDRMWMRPAPPAFTDDFERLHAEVTRVLTADLGVAPPRLPARVLVEGHSAGGVALWNIARGGTRLISDYLFLDAGFHEWADGCHAEVRAHHVDARVILVIRDGGIADPMRGPDPWCVDAPRLAAAWPQVRGACEADPRARPRGEECARWRKLAEGWPKVQAWCDAMQGDMRAYPDVIVHRTKVAHGKQPRAFFGGLQIPALVGPSR